MQNIPVPINSSIRQLTIDTPVDVGTSNNTTAATVFCNGEMHLFGRRHFVGVVHRALQTIQNLSDGIFKSKSVFATTPFQYWIDTWTIASPFDLINITKIADINITFEEKDTKYVSFLQ